ncbi:MAG: DUF2232 domain-containing protein [Candidatus Cloacimonetes bacterium]|nr:DUF2232 domain-containing protein [Candidatus Cloacimonadota bacterium]
MFLVAAIAVILAMFSPLLGLVFTVGVGGRYQLSRINHVFYLAMVIPLVIFFLTSIIDIVTFTDISSGVILSSVAFFLVLKKQEDYVLAIFAVVIINVIYGLLRHLIFGNTFALMVSATIEEYQSILQERMQQNSENIILATELLHSVKQLLIKYFTGLWSFSMTLGIYLGAVIYSRKKMPGWQHRLIRLPQGLIYILILTLIMLLIAPARTLAVNVMLVIFPLLLIQGIAILDFFWGKYFTKSRFLLYLLIVAIIFNHYLIILIGLMGLFDIWFNFRKIRTVEENINESDSD